MTVPGKIIFMSHLIAQDGTRSMQKTMALIKVLLSASLRTVSLPAVRVNRGHENILLDMVTMATYKADYKFTNTLPCEKEPKLLENFTTRNCQV